MIKSIVIFSLAILLAACSTTTPKKYLNNAVVSSDVYTKDTIALKKEIYDFYALENKIHKKNPNFERKILRLQIDTLIYGKDNKFVALVLFDDYNKYVKLLNSDKEPVSYTGECVIGYKINDSIQMSSILVLRTSSDKSRDAAKRLLRNEYLRMLTNKKGVYNINDIRFWDSDVWNFSLVEKTKEFYEKQQDSTIETYP